MSFTLIGSNDTVNSGATTSGAVVNLASGDLNDTVNGLNNRIVAASNDVVLVNGDYSNVTLGGGGTVTFGEASGTVNTDGALISTVGSGGTPPPRPRTPPPCWSRQ